MTEISLNILDIAQNSVTSGASLIEIIVSEQPGDDRLSVTVTDNGCGMTAEQVENVTDPFYTTRSTRSVGLGTSFFKMAAEMTGGKFSIESEPGSGTSVLAEFVMSHVDRMPLGDMCGTVCTLIRMNPNLDFAYTHSVSGESFALDTRELREVLTDVPLDSHEVVGWINEYITENTERLKQK